MEATNYMMPVYTYKWKESTPVPIKIIIIKINNRLFKDGYEMNIYL